MRAIRKLGGLAAAVAAVCAGRAYGQTTATWVATVSGNWNDGARWSANPAFPNNGGGTNYAAVVDAVGGVYTVTIGTAVTVDSLTLNSANAIVRQTNGGLTLVNGLDVQAGTFLLTAGAVTTPSLSGAGVISFDGGNGGSQTLRPSAGGTLTIAAGTIVRTGTGSGTIGRVDGGLVNNGTLVADSGRTLTILGEQWVNNGTFKVDGGSLRLGGTVETAKLGMIAYTSGSVVFRGALVNTGATLALSAATGSWSLDSFGKIVGGTVNGTGGKGVVVSSGVSTLDGVTVAGTGLTVLGSGTVTAMNGLTLSNTTVPVGDDSGTGTVQFDGTQTLGGTGEVHLLGRGTLKPVGVPAGTLTIGSGVTVRSKGFYGIVGDVNYGLVNLGTITSEGTNQFLDVAGSSFTNAGAINVSTGGVTLTNVNNTGTLNLTGGTTRLLGAWHNGGTANATNAILDLGGTFGLGDVGTINRSGGTVRVSGTMDLRGGTLALTTATGPWVLAGTGRITNGTITAGGTALVQFATPGPSGTLDNVTVGATVQVPYSAQVTVQNGLTLAPDASITLSATNFAVPTRLDFDGTQTLGGAGEVVFSGPYGVVAPVAGTLTVGPSVTVRTTIGGGGVLGDAALPLVNQGMVTSTTANGIRVLGSAVMNTGTIRALAGGALTVRNLQNQGTISSAGTTLIIDGAWHNGGTITTSAGTTRLGGVFGYADIGNFMRTGGSLFLDGELDNTGNTLNLASRFNGAVTLAGAMKGGTVVSSVGAPFTIAAGGVTTAMLDGVTLDGDATVNGQSVFRVQNGLTINAGRKVVVTGGEEMYASNTQTIGGGGEIQYSAPSGIINPLANVLTFGPAMTVRTTGANGGVTIGNAFGSVVNNGTIVSGAAGGYVSLEGNFTNNGVIRADAGNLNLGGTDSLGSWGTLHRNGGQVNFVGTLNNAGKTFDPFATPVGPVNLGTGARILGGTIASSGGVTKVMRVTPNAPNSVGLVDVTLATSLDVLSAVVGVTGTLTLSGNPTVRLVGSPGTTTSLDFSPNGALMGTGTVSFEDPTATENSVRVSNGTMTIGPNITIRATTGAGRVSGGTVMNQGTIAAAAAGKMIILEGTFNNQGTVEARGGGTVYTASPLTNLAGNTLTGGTWAAYAGSTINFNGRTFATNAADVKLDGAGSTFAAVAPLANNTGSFAIDHGRNFTTAGALANAGTLRVGAGSTLTVAGPLTNTGTIEGTGTIVTNVTNAGTAAPGQSPGMLTITGNFTQTAAGILEIEIAGPAAGTEYDVLKVSGAAALAGTLEITLLGGYVPPNGTTFEFVEAAGGESIAFDRVVLPPGVQWDTAALASGQITVVPEPGLAGWAVGAMVGLAWRQRGPGRRRA